MALKLRVCVSQQLTLCNLPNFVLARAPSIHRKQILLATCLLSYTILAHKVGKSFCFNVLVRDHFLIEGDWRFRPAHALPPRPYSSPDWPANPFLQLIND